MKHHVQHDVHCITCYHHIVISNLFCSCVTFCSNILLRKNSKMRCVMKQQTIFLLLLRYHYLYCSFHTNIIMLWTRDYRLTRSCHNTVSVLSLSCESIVKSCLFITLCCVVLSWEQSLHSCLHFHARLVQVSKESDSISLQSICNIFDLFLGFFQNRIHWVVPFLSSCLECNAGMSFCCCYAFFPNRQPNCHSRFILWCLVGPQILGFTWNISPKNFKQLGYKLDMIYFLFHSIFFAIYSCLKTRNLW